MEESSLDISARKVENATGEICGEFITFIPKHVTSPPGLMAFGCSARLQGKAVVSGRDDFMIWRWDEKWETWEQYTRSLTTKNFLEEIMSFWNARAMSLFRSKMFAIVRKCFHYFNFMLVCIKPVWGKQCKRLYIVRGTSEAIMCDNQFKLV